MLMRIKIKRIIDDKKRTTKEERMLKIYAVIERDRFGNEKIKGLYKDLDKAFKVAGLNSKLNWALNGTSRGVETMEVIE